MKGGSGKPTQMTYGCPCSTGLQCIGSGHYDIPLGEIGNTQAKTCYVHVGRQTELLHGVMNQMSRHIGKPTICLGENKDADQLRSNCKADQRLCFRYSDKTVPLLLKSEISRF